MGRDGEMSTDQVTKSLRVNVEVDEDKIANIFDKAIRQTLQDAMYGNDGAIKMLEKPAFDRTQRISRPDVKQSEMIRLMYFKS